MGRFVLLARGSINFASWDACTATERVVRLARKGNTPSTIGAILRDGEGIPDVRAVTAKKITRILKAKGLSPALPEDLYYLIKKAVGMRKHLEKNNKDRDQKFRLVLTES